MTWRNEIRGKMQNNEMRKEAEGQDERKKNMLKYGMKERETIGR